MLAADTGWKRSPVRLQTTTAAGRPTEGSHSEMAFRPLTRDLETSSGVSGISAQTRCRARR
ncbi:MAG: hypothetical protein DMF91_14150 [Acidobacteria bacterium]|nr:MAG: hypothetical protein DMF91_14150 [Acidobacteriota bacterium]